MIKKEPKLAKSNSLVRAAYRLSLSETRLISLIMSEVKLEQLSYTVHVKDYADTFYIGLSAAYEALVEATETLSKRQLTVYNDKGRLLMNWVQSIQYYNDESKLTLKLSQDIVPLLFDLKSHFTMYSLKEISKLTSMYTIRLYEIAKSYQSVGMFALSLEEFRRTFEMDEQYRQDNIQNRIIKPALKQIGEHTDILVEYRPVKQERAVIGYKFTVTENARTKQPKPTPLKFNSTLERQLLKEVQKGRPTLTEKDVITLAEREGFTLVQALELLKRLP